MVPAKPLFPTLNTRNPLAKGLICYYPMNEGGGNYCYDIVNGDVMTIHGGNLWVKTAIGSALYFDGTNTQYAIGSEARLPFSNADRTIGVLWNTSALPARVHITACWYGQRWYNVGFGIFGNAASYSPVGNAAVSQYGGQAYTPYGINDGTWRVVLGAIWPTGAGTGTMAVIESENWYTADASINTTAAPGLIIGADSSSPSEGFQGSIGGFFAWNRVLSQYDVKSFISDPFGLVKPPAREFFSDLIFPPSAPVGPSIVPLASYYYSMMSRA